MASKIVMPGQGENDDPSTLTVWNFQEGDQVSRGDVLCEAERDKMTFEVEAPDSGVLLKRLYNEGDTVPDESTIGYIGEPDEQVPDLDETSDTAVPARSGTAADESTPVETAEQPVEPGVSSPPSHEQSPRPSHQRSSGKIRISPRARKLAEKHDVDVSTVTGSGSGGRIVVRDVEAAMAGQGAAIGRPSPSTSQPAAQARPTQEGQVVPVIGVRKTIASRMVESLSTTAQLTLHAAANASSLLSYRKRLKASPEETGLTGVTINDLVMYAVSRVLPRFRRLNSHFLGETIAEYADVNLGMAVDTERGLMVPVIQGAHRLSLKEVSERAAELRRACETGTVTADEMSSGTFTVTNLGPLGVEFFTPVLNVPQVAILGVGSIQPRPVMIDDQLDFAPHIGLSLTVDHQAVDGAPAAAFLREVVRGLEEFELLLAV